MWLPTYLPVRSQGSNFSFCSGIGYLAELQGWKMRSSENDILLPEIPVPTHRRVAPDPSAW